MHLHIIGGFLGSGKTTSIIGAAKYLAGQGIRVGVITNDQGRHLVDTTIIRSQDLPAMEVTGGCFCCNFNDLNQCLQQLLDDHQTQVIFAESVGSCADVVATVVKPLLELEIGAVKPNSFSVFTDIRLLRRLLLGLEMPFSEDVNYIFTKQIEEAGLLIINKADLFSSQEVDQVLQLARNNYRDKPVVVQNSLDESDIEKWVDALQIDKYPLPVRSLELDYARYAAGESRMVWIDRVYALSAEPQEMPSLLMDIITSWQNAIIEQNLDAGHVKVILRADGVGLKLSLAQVEPGKNPEFADFIEKKDRFQKDQVEILLNVLVEGNLEHVTSVMENVITNEVAKHEAGLQMRQSFNRRPGYPKPTYRILD